EINIAVVEGIADLEIGGVNILLNTEPVESNAPKWNKIGSYTGQLVIAEAEGSNYFRMPVLTSVEIGDRPRFRGDYVYKLVRNKTYTASWKAVHGEVMDDTAYGGIYNSNGIIRQNFSEA